MIPWKIHLLRPCYDFFFLHNRWFKELLGSVTFSRGGVDPNISPTATSDQATGGEYKGQGHNQRRLMTGTYQAFLVEEQQFQHSGPITTHVHRLPRSLDRGDSLSASVQPACGLEHLRASQTYYCLKLPSA
eukprot:TRINITY_DN2555_c0_g1_i6.p1 TRINITY_DN2555_c0_g1~~TRINITY_DN2555_c0_g1_i6.p1  ORF type:complete len:154 (+),score=4.58 TRINITY_DN2555_c0_g1_i6:70-462(+)